uniref:O(6)-methylguanine-induced apoptosis 2-like n=1 Tax=Phallusia mammillata TaxID=59560 RepID=A0A6F9DU06_9ASCI|nr:O(6)-methylguanine-induced apoptosis 2-like [Phallusia mammillata]
MALDSIQPIESVQRIHSRVTGKLYKGHGITAASASIPSKYQTIVTNNADKKGFCTQAKRFSEDYYVNDIPGPGNYQCPHGEIEKKSTSFSKKGTGSFASKTYRAMKSQQSRTPGAGSYNLPSLLSTRKEFNRANSSSFHLPIALTTQDTMVGPVRAPAPNQYNVQKFNVGKNYGVAAEAAFKSKTKRQTIPVGSTRVPSPSHYNIRDDGIRPTAKAPTSIFSSTTKRDVISKPADNPGPGTYKPFHPSSPTNKLTFPRRHYLCISAPAMALPAPVENPGPGSYELVDYEGPTKHYMSSGVFVSNTSRWTFNHPTKDNPGPASYRPERMGKQSFIYNAQNRWVPL